MTERLRLASARIAPVSLDRETTLRRVIDGIEQAAADLPWARGGSCLVAPDVSWWVEPIEDRHGLFVVEIEHAALRHARQNFDPSGHCSRPEVFELQVDHRRQRLVRLEDDQERRDACAKQPRP